MSGCIKSLGLTFIRSTDPAQIIACVSANRKEMLPKAYERLYESDTQKARLMVSDLQVTFKQSLCQ